MSKKTAQKLLELIISEPNKLLNNPKLSQREDYLLGRDIEYRYLVCKNYKLIYSIDTKEKLIKIADVFDTRQNPIKIKRSK